MEYRYAVFHVSGNWIETSAIATGYWEAIGLAWNVIDSVKEKYFLRNFLNKEIRDTKQMARIAYA